MQVGDETTVGDLDAFRPAVGARGIAHGDHLVPGIGDRNLLEHLVARRERGNGGKAVCVAPQQEKLLGIGSAKTKRS